jgi:outer membrane protein OmpU
MKKILFATTALVATAGVAAAEVSGTGPGMINIRGAAEMGVIGGSERDAQFHTDIDVSFSMAGEADNGLTFTAVVDLDENGAFANTTQGGETIAIAYGGLSLTMGDTDGALDWAMTELDAGGAIDDDHTAHAGFSGNGGLDFGDLIESAGEAAASGDVGDLFGDVSSIGLDGLYDGQIARATYTSGNFSVAASLEVADTRDVAVDAADGPFGVDTDWEAGAVYGFGARYSMEGVTFGVGFQSATIQSETAGIDDISARAIGASVSYTMDSLTVGVNVGRNTIGFAGDDIEINHMGVGASYTMNSLTLAANYGQYAYDIEGFDEFTNSGWGVSATYALGGGLTAQFGYGASSFDEDLDLDDTNRWSLGLAMSF